jgi:leucyl-tRNA synthetase
MVVYTTRPDTIFGVDFMVVAPEHEMVKEITSAEQKAAVNQYLDYVKSRSERERLAEVKSITGAFTGAYAINPFDRREIPIWISEYVLAGYGTGAIMAVPSGDQRDFSFAKHFGIAITNIIGDAFNGNEANSTKDAVLQNSGFLNGIVMREAMNIVIDKLEEMGIGKRQINYRMRDAGFSRQRYWGEPFPIVYKGGIAYPMDESELPLELPYVDSYRPGPEGEGPLANITEWVSGEPGQGHRETNTMPGYAGSSWYFLRYMDPKNDNQLVDKKIADYWGQVDLYIGGTEHAVGHLLYSRMWTKALYDLDYIGFDEPYKRLVNQGMIQGASRFVYRVKGSNLYVSAGLKDKYETDKLHADVSIVDGVELDVEAFRLSKPDYINAEFILEDDKYICGTEIEKMSKSKYNVVNPDDIVERFGADTFRMYEMFLGPVEQSKPWDTKGIEGVHRFLRKFWRLFADETKGLIVTNGAPTPAELKVLHKTIKKIEDDTERFSFNTAVSTFMIAVNELSDLKCHKKEILQPLLILLTPYAPHIAEELWTLLANEGSVLDAPFPAFEEKYLVESSKEYPISINGKVRANINIALDVAQPEVEQIVLSNNLVQKWLEGKQPKKIIFVKGKMVNVVI